MAQAGGGADSLTLQLQAARAVAAEQGLELRQLKASVRARLFGIIETPPTLGDYTIVRLIGRGGMGAVYEARDAHGEVVALKALRGCEATALVRFKHEFRALSDLVHPNLALLYSLVVAGDQAYLTMEHIDGVDLLSHLQACRSSEAIFAALRQLVDGLAALHAAGKLHRDVKPTNVLVTPEGRVVILDFGLVQELAVGAPGEGLAGTPAYLAPELLIGGTATTASDWYSVGVMLYEALTGELPFGGGGGLAALRDKCQRDPVAPELRAPGADPGLSRLCMQLLCRDPQLRPDRAAIVAALSRGTGDPRVSFGTGVSRSPRGPAGPAGLVGRADELAALRQALAGVGPGRAAVALLRGGSGVGKTALVDSFLLEVSGPAIVLRGRCYEREQVPHNAFDGLVDELALVMQGWPEAVQAAAGGGDVAALVRLFPGLKRLLPGGDEEGAAATRSRTGPFAVVSTRAGTRSQAGRSRRAPGTGEEARPVEPESRWRERAYAAFKGLLAWLAERRAVVLYIDDLQWADADSAALLTELVSAPAPACLLLASYRGADGGAAPVVRGLVQRLRGGGARLWELTVEPLALAEAEQLARALLGSGLASSYAGAVASESGGVPLFVHELVHEVLASGGAWPGRLEDLIAARVQRLPPTARDVLELLAVAARPLAHGLVLGLPGGASLGRAALQTLSAARLVRVGRSERGELVEVFHDRVRETVLASLSALRERACHRRLAAAMESWPGEALAEPEILAHHLHAAGDPEGARQHMITAAAQAAGSLAFARAAELSLAAVRLCPVEDAVGRRALRVDAARALIHAGNHAEAAACFLAAAAEAGPVLALELQQQAAEALLTCGATQQGEALLQAVLRALGSPLPQTRVAMLLRVARSRLWLRRNGLAFTARQASEVAREQLLRLDTLRLARLAVVSLDPTTARMYQLEHLRQCLEVGEPRRIVHAVAGHAGYLAHEGARTRVEVARLLDQARAIAVRHGVADERYIDVCTGMAAFGLGAWRSALDHFEAALPAVDGAPPSVGGAALYAYCGVWTLACSFYLGDLQALSVRRDRYLELVRAVGDRANEGRLCVSMQVFVALAADDPQGAAQGLAAAQQGWSRGGFAMERAHAFLAERAIDLYVGEGGRAWSRCAAQWPAFARSHMAQGQHGRVFGEFWRGGCALLAAAELRGRPAERLRAIAAEAERRIVAQEVGWGDPLAQLLRAGLAVQRGRPELARTALALAVAGFERVEMRLWAAAAGWHESRLAGDAVARAAHEQRMRACGVLQPERMAAALAPGLL
ncbi:MAG: protein kinase [Nannocystis sp.]|uniref:serine/threonine-protein kinase n=1 Tax=Nannocystis sp. TaxID=1962667 RepID=UPI002428CECE|nr:serine/threonine-protein kinase [Nannocystis sp.]MBK9756326.1 protein kinase [Nannocystis sp.]